MRIIVNKRYGGYGFSMQALELLEKKTGRHSGDLIFERHYDDPDSGELAYPEDVIWVHEMSREDSVLLEIIDEIGVIAASGDYALLGTVEIPDGTPYSIYEYDGWETVESPRVVYG
jgi:hypothetical protein